MTYNTALGFSFFKHINDGFDLLKIDRISFESQYARFERLIGLTAENKLKLKFDKQEDSGDKLYKLIQDRRPLHGVDLEMLIE